MKGPGSELARVLLADSLQGANWPGSEKAVNQVSHIFVVIQLKVTSYEDKFYYRVLVSVICVTVMVRLCFIVAYS